MSWTSSEITGRFFYDCPIDDNIEELVMDVDGEVTADSPTARSWRSSPRSCP